MALLQEIKDVVVAAQGEAAYARMVADASDEFLQALLTGNNTPLLDYLNENDEYNLTTGDLTNIQSQPVDLGVPAGVPAEQNIFINPTAVESSFTINLPVDQDDLQVINYTFGGNLSGVVVQNLTISVSGGNNLFGIVPRRIWAGDSFRALFHNNNWYIQ